MAAAIAGDGERAATGGSGRQAAAAGGNRPCAGHGARCARCLTPPRSAGCSEAAPGAGGGLALKWGSLDRAQESSGGCHAHFQLAGATGRDAPVHKRPTNRSRHPRRETFTLARRLQPRRNRASTLGPSNAYSRVISLPAAAMSNTGEAAAHCPPHCCAPPRAHRVHAPTITGTPYADSLLLKPQSAWVSFARLHAALLERWRRPRPSPGTTRCR